MIVMIRGVIDRQFHFVIRAVPVAAQPIQIRTGELKLESALLDSRSHK
jgi:hypothetical protein